MTPQLPTRDAELEAAGDRIAEAITHLHGRHSPAALRALGQARVVLGKAFRDKMYPEDARNTLPVVLKDLATAEHAIRRGTPDDAARQLSVINRRLDDLYPRPVTKTESSP